jgi:hypothetical protein
VSGTIRVYINGVGLDADPDSTALDAVRLWDAAFAAELEAGARRLTDSRGLPASPETPLYAGAIFRVLPARSREPEDSST